MSDPIRKMDRTSKIVFGVMLIGLWILLVGLQAGGEFNFIEFRIAKWACLIFGASMLYSARKSDAYYKVEDELIEEMRWEASAAQYPVGTLVYELEEGAIVQEGKVTKYVDGKAHVEFPDESEWWFDKWGHRFMPEKLYGYLRDRPAVPPERVTIPPVILGAVGEVEGISKDAFDDWKHGLDAYLEGVGASTRAEHFRHEALVYGAVSGMAPQDFVKDGYNRFADPKLVKG